MVEVPTLISSPFSLKPWLQVQGLRALPAFDISVLTEMSKAREVSGILWGEWNRDQGHSNLGMSPRNPINAGPPPMSAKPCPLSQSPLFPTPFVRHTREGREAKLLGCTEKAFGLTFQQESK